MFTCRINQGEDGITELQHIVENDLNKVSKDFLS